MTDDSPAIPQEAEAVEVQEPGTAAAAPQPAAVRPEGRTTDYGTQTNKKIEEVVAACRRYGRNSIIALAGVPGTGKSFVAAVAAQVVADEPTRVFEVQFHPSFSYEEFIEGMRLGDNGRTETRNGVFLDWNDRAIDDPDNTYVLLIEELTRANLPSVMGELLTYVEYREGQKRRPFHTLYDRRRVYVAPNLVILATYNPTDRSALELDNALMRRMRMIACPPDTDQLREMLSGRNGLRPEVVAALAGIFDAAKKEAKEEYEYLMPFGHGIFSEVQAEQPDLYDLWHERIRPLIRRPVVEAHRLADIIEKAYPWRDRTYTVKPPAPATADGASAEANSEASTPE